MKTIEYPHTNQEREKIKNQIIKEWNQNRAYQVLAGLFSISLSDCLLEGLYPDISSVRCEICAREKDCIRLKLLQKEYGNISKIWVDFRCKCDKFVKKEKNEGILPQ
jgi:phage FluMu gp28-like protein